ncbi:uncharacterized protein LOC113514514 [Galleria mellonella]|uniref:Uncharacterized protein LOC113514514 n=1 Tax=Galleria mellonella TaxID=7137 RepID=A0A6J1WJM1_GALME|nr:uncharacterized protein LOC113514514 [Galleria mellonella]
MKMEIHMKLPFQTIVVFCFVILSSAKEDYENKLTKLWSLSSASNRDGSAIVNVTSASIVIQPTSYSSNQVPQRQSRITKYAFKPRAIPLRRSEQPSQVERSVYYSQDNVNKYKTETLFPGNYFPIAQEKSNKNLTQDFPYKPLDSEPFHPKAIPLIRSQEFQRRSLDVDEEPIIEKPEGFSEATASRRSLSYVLGLGDSAEIEEEDEDEDDILEDEAERKKGVKKPKYKKKKLKKYVLPLLLAYKMKYFALVPVMIGGLILLIGATGLAGFFFALFAAVMGLQKGGY